jgi:hypothetical protein
VSLDRYAEIGSAEVRGCGGHSFPQQYSQDLRASVPFASFREIVC